MPYARFDDLGGEGASFALTGFVGAIEADHVEEVRRALERAEEAARAGAWVAGFVTYEAAPAFDPSLVTRPPEPGTPLVWFGCFSGREALAPVSHPAAKAGWDWRHGWAQAEHAAAVAVIREHLAAGDSYQVNLTMRARARVADPLGLYATMASGQAGAYNAYIDTGRTAVVCASPELFFERTGDRIVTRPMKGTAGRGRWAAEEAAVTARLATSAKERSEHVMIVDLLRNDLGRVARPGTVKVETLAALERYPTVWQMTSTISAQASRGVGLVDVFGALFPCGSVTGAPKPRTMEIISSVEPDPRGAYCGAVGFIEPGGSRSRFAVAIRTAVVDSATGAATYGTGGGITWDSDAGAEWAEAAVKASILHVPPPPEGLFETLRFEPGSGPVDLSRHLQRMGDSAAYFGIPFDHEAAAKEVVAACEDVAEVTRVRLDLLRSGAMTVTLREMPAPAPGPVRLALAAEAVDSRDARLFHKCSDRRRYESLRAGRPGADDAVLWNERGEATETTIANLAVRHRGRWWTPPLDCGLLPGVGRQRLIDDGTLAEMVVPLALLETSELAVVNSLRGWRAAVLVNPDWAPTPSSS